MSSFTPTFKFRSLIVALNHQAINKKHIFQDVIIFESYIHAQVFISILDSREVQSIPP